MITKGKKIYANIFPLNYFQLRNIRKNKCFINKIKNECIQLNDSLCRVLFNSFIIYNFLKFYSAMNFFKI